MKILLVRLRLIGDVVFTTPLLRGLKRRFPDAELTYLVEPSAAPVLKGNPYIAELFTVPRGSGLARWREDLSLAAALRRRRFDVAIDLHGGPRSAWLTWASAAPRRIGYTIRGRSWMYTDIVRRAPDLGARHSVENQWDLLGPLGIGAADRERDPVEMVEDVAAAAAVDLRLQAGGFTARPLVILHASAGNPFRRWPEASFVEVMCDLIRRDPNRVVILFSGPSDAAAASRIIADARRQLGRLSSSVADIGDFDLSELRALTRRAAVYIGGDSGPLHIAATTATPIVALFGPTLAGRSMPWRSAEHFAEGVDAGELPCRPCRQRHCAPGDFRCLTGISPARVIEAAERALAISAARQRSTG